MDKDTYAALFHGAIKRALKLSGLDVDVSEPVVEFKGRPNPPAPISVDEAVNLLWLSSDRFYLVVDVMAIVGENNPPILFVR